MNCYKKLLALVFALCFFDCDLHEAGKNISPVIDASITQDGSSNIDASFNWDAGERDVMEIAHEAGPWNDASFDLWTPQGGPVTYHGGPVMVNPVSVYLIWYGDWSKDANTIAILEDLITDFDASDYYKINTSYYQLTTRGPGGIVYPQNNKKFVSAKINLTKSIYVGYTHGGSLLDADIEQIVLETTYNNHLTLDPNAAYFVITSKDISEGGLFGNGLCSDYCGWHSNSSINNFNIDIKSAFVGDVSRCLNSCSVQSKYFDNGFIRSPNNNWGADAIASIVIHELSEMLTDPDPMTRPAWVAGSLYETMDVCAWQFGQLYITSNNSVANVKIGNRDFLIQENYLQNDKCAMSLE